MKMHLIYNQKQLFNKQTVSNFRIGLFTKWWQSTSRIFAKRGIEPDIIKASGLSSKNYRGLSDMFREDNDTTNRCSRGLPIGFTARLLKMMTMFQNYINTPQTIVYDKSRHVLD